MSVASVLTMKSPDGEKKKQPRRRPKVKTESYLLRCSPTELNRWFRDSQKLGYSSLAEYIRDVLNKKIDPILDSIDQEQQHRPREKKTKLTGKGQYDRQAARQEADDFTEDLDYEEDPEEEEEEDHLGGSARSADFHQKRDNRSHSRWMEDHLAKDGTWA